MDDIHGIRVKNFCVVKVIFRRIGTLWNEGTIIIDKDTFDFAGHLTNDTIIGRYYKEKNYYDIEYIKHDVVFENPMQEYFEYAGSEIPVEEIRIYSLDVATHIRSVEQSILNTEFDFPFEDEEGDFVLTFYDQVLDYVECLKVMSANSDIVELVED